MSAEAPVATRAHTFHVDLSEALPDHDYVVVAPGHEQTLLAHTDASRQLLTAKNANSVRAARLGAATHFTSSAVMMPVSRAYRVHVKAVPHDSTQPSFVHAAAICVPKSDLAINEQADEPINWVTTAQAFLFHHPDLQTPDPQVSAIVMEHLSFETNPTNYALIEQLAEEMAIAGPPTTDPNKGWATLVPFTTEEGETLHLQNPTPDIQEKAGDAMTAVMISTKNDLRLQDRKWTFTEGVSTEDSSVHVPQLAAAIRTGAAGDAWKATVDNVNIVHGMHVSVTVLDQTERRVRIRVENTYIRYLGAYIQFLDVDMQPMNTPTWRPDRGSFFNNDMQYANFRGLGSVRPVTTVMSIPVVRDPGTLDVEVTFPEGAVAAGIFGCGIGTGVQPHPRANLYGGLMTGLANFAIPGLLLGFGIAGETYGPLYDLLNDREVIAHLIVTGLYLYGAMFAYEGIAHGRMNWRAFASLSQLIFSKAMKKILNWVTLKLSGGAVRNAIPFGGWIVLAMNTAAGILQIARTIVDVATSPWSIPNRLSTTIDSTVTIFPDPRYCVFPQPPAGRKASCTVSMIFQANRPTVTSTIANISGTSLEASFSNQLGGRVKFEANFYIDTWLAGTASTGWLPNDQQNTTSITLILLQNPVPLHEESVYVHSQILTYQNDGYRWTTTARAPASTIANTDPSQSGNAISVWRGLTLSQRHARLGWAWKAAGLGIPSSSGTRGTQLFAMQTIDIPGMPTCRDSFPSAGFDAPTQIIFDHYPPKFLMENDEWVIEHNRPVPDPKDVDLGAYWVDPRKAALDAEAGGGYHLRKIDGSFDLSPAQPSYGRFPWAPDSLVIHPTGHVVAINTRYAKFMVLQLSPTGRTDILTPLAHTFAGTGMDFAGSGGRAGLLVNPVAVTCTYDGTILILERHRIQAFDTHANPVNAFKDSDGKASPFLPIDPSPTYLDITCSGNQDLAYIHVLSYRDRGRNPSDYDMAIYQFGKNAPSNNPLVTTSSFPAARIATDMWHSVYALNWEMTTNGQGRSAGPAQGNGAGPAGRTVPSISLWMPPVP